MAFGALTGVFTGGIGAAGEAVAANFAKQGAKEIAKVGAKKLAVRAVTGGAAGITSKAVNEIKECAVNDKKWSDFGKELDANGKENGTVSAWLLSAGSGVLGGRKHFT